jgi:hypothetical protein
MTNRRWSHVVAAVAVGWLSMQAAQAGVSAEEAAQLKTTLTPLGAERQGNKEGTIPEWTGGLVKPGKSGGRRDDPFAAEKPLYSINASNVASHADKLTEGTRLMFKRFPQSYRIDVYPTHRTAAAPAWVYDNTFRNATRATLKDGMPQGAYGGIPFPIPKAGKEVMWNHVLRWRGEAWHFEASQILTTADGKHVLSADAAGDINMPYYYKDGSPEKFDGTYWLLRLINTGPPLRAGEGIVGRENYDPEKIQAWVYLTGQRRVRKLPNPCCDSPTPSAAGQMFFDETEGFTGRMTRFDFKLLGKKEMLVPYNTNRTLQPTRATDLLGEHHLNPDLLRWELHRVWVVEATVAPGQRHQAARNLYYIDEDSWHVLLADRWDAKGTLWRSLWFLTITAPEVPAVEGMTFGVYDHLSGSWFANNVFNEKADQFKLMPRYDDAVFTPEALSGEGVR